MRDSALSFLIQRNTVLPITGINKPWNGKVAKRMKTLIHFYNEQREDILATVFNACCTKMLSMLLVFHNTENGK